jgi:hypothetical protein
MWTSAGPTGQRDDENDAGSKCARPKQDHASAGFRRRKDDDEAWTGFHRRKDAKPVKVISHAKIGGTTRAPTVRDTSISLWRPVAVANCFAK